MKESAFMKKKLLMAALSIAMAFAAAVPAFASEGVVSRAAPPICKNVIIRNSADLSQIVTVASSATPGENDEVWTWTDRGMVLTQRWNFVANNRGPGHYYLCPSQDSSIALNVYRSGSYPCTMFTAGGANALDTDLTVGRLGNQYTIFNIANSRYLNMTNTQKYKFSDGYGFGLNWIQSQGKINWLLDQ